MESEHPNLIVGQVYSAVNFEGFPLRYTILSVTEDLPTFKAKQEVPCLSGGINPLPKGCPNDFYTRPQCYLCVSRILRHKPLPKPKMMVRYCLEKCMGGVWVHWHNLEYPALGFFKQGLPKKTLMETA